MENIKKAIEFHKKGDYKNAEIFYKKFLNKNPNEARAHALLGSLYMQNNNLNSALSSLQKAFSLDNSTDIETDLALCYFKLKNYKNAYLHLKNILKTNNSKALSDTIIECCKNLNLKNETLKYLISSLEFEKTPDIFKLREIADIAYDLEDFKTAILFYKKILEIYPKDFVAWNNLGLVFEFINDLDSAENCYNKAIKIKPNADFYYNLSIVLRRKKKYKNSLKNLNLAKELNPKMPIYSHAFGILHLIQKDFSGYKPYIDYLKAKEKQNPIKSMWNGKNDKNSILLIRATAGYGDNIMFARYLDFLNADNFKKVIFQVPNQMYDLMKFNFPNLTVKSLEEQALYDFGTILMDLPYIFNLDFNHIPSPEKFLLTPAEYAKKWENYFDETKYKIGIFFKGTSIHKRTLRNRSIEIERLSPLFEIKNAHFYSMQPEKIFKDKLKKYNVNDLSDKIGNFADTAAIIDKIDIVISTDSSVLHLAGALGKKTYLMLPYSTDWRWFEDDKKTPWYNSVEIFRQETEGDWTPVLQRIKDKILENIDTICKN